VEQVIEHSVSWGGDAGSAGIEIDLASVMQAGRWKSNRMPMGYGEHVLAARGGMAGAAEKQGRSSRDPRGV
jgi:hypothetical protein